MVNCGICSVTTIDRHCSNTPQTCYDCCAHNVAILTCPYHFGQMGLTEAASRLAGGQVHASLIPVVVDTAAADAARRAGESDAHAVIRSAESERRERSNSSPAAAGQASQSSIAPSRHQPAAASTTASAASVVSLAAMRAELEADRAAAQVERAAIRAQLDDQAAATRQLSALLARLQPTALESAASSLSTPAPPSAPVPHPHRGAVLDRSAAAALVNTLSAAALDGGDSDEDAPEVLTHSHTHTQRASILPAAFVPTPSGTEQSAQQQLAAIVSGLNKQGTKAKYSTIADLDEALDDWATASIARLGWSVSTS